MPRVNPSTIKTLYYQMLRIRRFEEVIAERYRDQEMRCPVHLCIGEEAPAVGVCAHLTAQDTVFSYHRGHAHYLAKGGDAKKFIAELYGRKTGCAGGYGGSMHLIDEKVGFLGSAPLVGGTVPLAVGVALANKIKKQSHVTVSFFGDACFEEGVVHESLNFAALHKLPVVFVCENNSYSVITPLRLRQPNRPIWPVAKAHGIEAAHGDGNNIEEVYHLTKKALARSRQGKGPQFLEFETYRCIEHCGPDKDDDLPYRPKKEILNWRKRCPIKQTKNALLKNHICTKNDLETMERKINSEIDEAFSFALNSPSPERVFNTR